MMVRDVIRAALDAVSEAYSAIEDDDYALAEPEIKAEAIGLAGSALDDLEAALRLTTEPE